MLSCVFIFTHITIELITNSWKRIVINCVSSYIIILGYSIHWNCILDHQLKLQLHMKFDLKKNSSLDYFQKKGKCESY